MSALIATGLPGAAKTVSFKIVETSDVHGNFFPYDFINNHEGKGSLARVQTYLDTVHKELPPSHVLLFDNGDILQGQPAAYYYNFIDTVSTHLGARILDFMGYDAVTLGNHDIETGHSVYGRWRAQLAMPVLGANIIDSVTGEPYVAPYKMFDIDGVRVAVLGMITPGIPGWLPENLWSGLRFDDMVETARRWVPMIKEREKPHLIVGLFHSGRDDKKLAGGISENQSLTVAREVPGFDIVLMGHDHSTYMDFVKNTEGRDVLAANPANNARRVVAIDVEVTLDDAGEVMQLSARGDAVSTDQYEPSKEFMERFEAERKAVEEFVNRRVGVFADTLTTRDAYFGPSAFIDFIHQMQLDITGADISMTAPLSFDATIAAGPVTVADMFNLYKYENMLYTMRLTGKEVKDYLEMSYDLWTNTMTGADEHLLKVRDTGSADMTHTGFVHPSYNFDSAAGIIYEVDVTKPRGEKITVLSMADGTPFDLDAIYKVAINSYRGNGGGNLLTEGAGIAKEDLKGRILNSTDKDLRYYLMQYIEQRGKVDPKPLNQWRFVPEAIVEPAARRDRELLFPSGGK